MHITNISIFPNMFDILQNEGVISRAIKNKIITLDSLNPRDFACNKYKNIDDKPFGGGPGMVMQIEPLHLSLNQALSMHKKKPLVIHLSPQGLKFNQNLAQNLAKKDNLILISGRYEGIDERFLENFVDIEISIGDYILSGGELAAMVVIDTIARTIPGVLGNHKSLNDSFTSNLLDYPQYTTPRDYCGFKVPDVLISGNHKKIRLWRLEQSLSRTLNKRVDLLDGCSLSGEEKEMLEKIKFKQKINKILGAKNEK